MLANFDTFRDNSDYNVAAFEAVDWLHSPAHNGRLKKNINLPAGYREGRLLSVTVVNVANVSC